MSKWRRWEKSPITPEVLAKFDEFLVEVQRVLQASGHEAELVSPNLGYRHTYSRHLRLAGQGRGTRAYAHDLTVNGFEHRTHGLMVEVQWGWSIENKRRFVFAKVGVAQVVQEVLDRLAKCEAEKALAEADAQRKQDVSAAAEAALGFRAEQDYSSDLEITPLRNAAGEVVLSVQVRKHLLLTPDQLKALVEHLGLTLKSKGEGA